MKDTYSGSALKSPAIQKSNRFCADYQRDKNHPKNLTLYRRGIVSAKETTPMDTILETEEWLGDIHEYSGEEATIYTDGSGGRRSKDKRLRRCGWAWVLPKANTHKEARYGARGSQGGPQTVPRAELKAIHHCLASIKHHKTIGRLTIVSDCKMAVDGLHKGRQYTSRQNWEYYGAAYGMNMNSAPNMVFTSPSSRSSHIQKQNIKYLLT